MRKTGIRLGIAVLTVLLAISGVDFGITIFAEYRLSRTVRSANSLSWDPSVAILGFPFIPQALRHRYSEVEIKANDVQHPHVGKAALETTLHGIDLVDASWLIRPDADLPVEKVESRIIVDSTHLGGFIGIKDLIVEAPTRETDDATESGISDSHGLVFTGTPKSAGFTQRVSVAVDLSISGPTQTTLELTPTGVLTGPGTADQDVPDDQKAAVLQAFRSSLPDQRLPFGVAPTTTGARGSDVIIEGIAEGLTIELAGFRQS